MHVRFVDPTDPSKNESQKMKDIRQFIWKYLISSLWDTPAYYLIQVSERSINFDIASVYTGLKELASCTSRIELGLEIRRFWNHVYEQKTLESVLLECEEHVDMLIRMQESCKMKVTFDQEVVLLK